MRAVLQRVTRASVSVGGTQLGHCKAGLLILVCAMQGDTDDTARKLAAKVSKLRIFKDGDGKMNRSIVDTGGEALVVSQFTLAADTTRGNRPGFSAAAHPDDGKRLYQAFAEGLCQCGISVETGEFGADMAVELINDGPVTIWLDSA